jgi:hypothetical protein
MQDLPHREIRVVVPFQSSTVFVPVGVILTVAVLQAEGKISRAPAARRRLRARSLTRLNFAGFGMTPSEKIQTSPVPNFTAIDSLFAAGYALTNGSDLPPRHAHSGWSHLQAKPCFVPDVEQA